MNNKDDIIANLVEQIKDMKLQISEIAKDKQTQIDNLSTKLDEANNKITILKECSLQICEPESKLDNTLGAAKIPLSIIPYVGSIACEAISARDKVYEEQKKSDVTDRLNKIS